MVEYRPVPARPWREYRTGEELSSLPSAYGGQLQGHQRCRAVGLGENLVPCSQQRVASSVYCYYHDKVQRGLSETQTESYPVMPLPRQGYWLIEGTSMLAA